MYGRYHMDVECQWTILVQPSQTIRLTLYDFELDVRRAAVCHDYVAVTYRQRPLGQHYYHIVGLLLYIPHC